MPSGSNPNLSNSTDTVYPEHLSRLHRRIVPKKRKGGSSRYRTQPVTFSEIKEAPSYSQAAYPGGREVIRTAFLKRHFPEVGIEAVLHSEMDEDNVVEEPASCRATSTQELQRLNEKFEIFRRSSDLVFHSSKEESSVSDTTPSPNENTNIGLITSRSLGIISQKTPTSLKEEM